MSNTVELRAIRAAVRQSGRSLSYSAHLYVNGRHFADVSNDGGATRDSFSRAPGWSGNYAATMRELRSDFAARGSSLQDYCRGQAAEAVERRNLSSRLSRRVMALHEGRVRVAKGKRSDDLIERVKRQWTGAVVLNELPLGEALSLVRGSRSAAGASSAAMV